MKKLGHTKIHDQISNERTEHPIFTIIFVVLVVLIFIIPLVRVKDIEKKTYVPPASYRSEYTWDGKIIKSIASDNTK